MLHVRRQIRPRDDLPALHAHIQDERTRGQAWLLGEPRAHAWLLDGGDGPEGEAACEEGRGDQDTPLFRGCPLRASPALPAVPLPPQPPAQGTPDHSWQGGNDSRSTKDMDVGARGLGDLWCLVYSSLAGPWSAWVASSRIGSDLAKPVRLHSFATLPVQADFQLRNRSDQGAGEHGGTTP